MFRLPSPGTEKQDGSSPLTNEAEGWQEAHANRNWHNSVLFAMFETRPDQGNSASLQYQWSLRWSFISLKDIYDAHSNSFLKLLFCLLVIHFRKTGPNWKPVCCRDIACSEERASWRGPKNYINSHLEHKRNWWPQPASWQATMHITKHTGHKEKKQISTSWLISPGLLPRTD